MSERYACRFYMELIDQYVEVRRILAEKDIKKVFGDTVVEALKNTLGESCMQAVLFYLQLYQFADRPSEFHNGLYSIFKEGTTVLEKMIVKELYRKLGLPYEDKPVFDFEEHMNLARQIIATRIKVVEQK